MDALDGVLMVPPDRGQILGRAVWKARYVVVGRRIIPSSRDDVNNSSHSQSINTGGGNYVTYTPSDKPSSASTKQLTDDYFISVYKSKEDLEPAQQWPLSSVSDCQVQSIAHPRKQGPVLPTLVITIMDKERKRRSSRTVGLISASKDLTSASVIFRTPPDDHHLSLQQWARFILSKKVPLSPDSPASPNFTQPFGSQTRDVPDYFPRPGSGNPNSRDMRTLQHKSSTATYSTGTRERPVTFSSASPSLRSKRSDVSSPSSNFVSAQQANYPIPGQLYTTVLPTDLPSPITSIDEYGSGFIEGWTVAQGRASSISSPVHGRDSISSQAQQTSVTDSSSPPRQRETILDRAFQLRCIPGLENEIPGEEKLSSLARFDALMREADEKRRQRKATELAEQTAMRSAFEADDSSEEEDETDASDSESNGDEYAHERDLRSPPPLLNYSAQRASEFESSRYEPTRTPTTTRSAFPKDQSTPTLTHPPPVRPHTAHARSRPNQSQRVMSTSQIPLATGSQDLPSVAENSPDTSTLRPSGDQQHSGTGTKRLSFTEFTKRLSSTSSLLLIQTNASGASSRGSSDDFQSASTPRPASLIPRGAAHPPPSRDGDHDDKEKKCGWRNSVGMIGTDGGFF